MRAKVTLFLLCFALWMIFSGKTEPLYLVLGVLSSIITVWISARADAINPPHLNRHIFPYSLWLIKEIFKSGFMVTRKIWSIKPNFKAEFVEFETLQTNSTGYTLLGNSMTLTPGTVAIQADDTHNVIIAHALTEEAAIDLRSGRMDRKVKKICG